MDKLPGGFEKPAPGSALDFLIAELLGDVGKVDVAIRELRSRLEGTEDRIREAGLAAADILTEATQRSIADIAQKAAFEESRRVQAARVEAAGLRSELMGEAYKVLGEIRAAKLGLTGRTVAVVCLVAAVASLGGTAVGFGLANGSVATFIAIWRSFL